MENKKSQMTEAELYREERKKRLASASKKNAKQSPQMSKAKKIAGKTISIILIVLLACGAIYGLLQFFGVPQKTLTATKIGDQKVSVAKYNLYYMDVYQQIYGQAQQVEAQYGKGTGVQLTGYDPTKSPMEQAYPHGKIEGVDIEKPTWADFFREETNQYLQSFLSYAKLAREAKITLTEEQTKSIDEQIKSLREAAKKQDYSLDRYLSHIYGKGVSEKLLREALEERMLASNFANQKSEELKGSITPEKIDKEFAANKGMYTVANVSAFQVPVDLSKVSSDATAEEKETARKEALAKAKEKADAYVAASTSLDAFVEQAKKENKNATSDKIQNNNIAPADLGEAAEKWLLDANRKIGDVTAIESGNSYLVLYVSVLPHKNTSKPVDVRHILIAFPDNGVDDKKNPKPVTDAQKAETKKKADEIYAEFLKNPTEENFIALAKAKTQDPGSKENGGLYQEISADGKMPDGSTLVPEFANWCHAEGRKVGDTGIVETSYGYHIMYLAGNDYPQAWETAAKNTLASNANSEFEKSILEDKANAIHPSKYVIKWASTQLESFIQKQFISK